ncbi:hypothetical protein LINPERHAP1_LOCUS25015 [Linum perenne]
MDVETQCVDPKYWRTDLKKTNCKQNHQEQNCNIISRHKKKKFAEGCMGVAMNCTTQNCTILAKCNRLELFSYYVHRSNNSK